jgi:hypothetical protein
MMRDDCDACTAYYDWTLRFDTASYTNNTAH